MLYLKVIFILAVNKLSGKFMVYFGIKSERKLMKPNRLVIIGYYVYISWYRVIQ